MLVDGDRARLRSEVDDVPAAARRDHRLADRLRHEKRALQIDSDRLVPVVERQLVSRRKEHNAGAVDQDVDAAECGQSAVDRLLHRRRVRHVASKRHRAAAEGLRFGLGGGDVEVDDGDPRPLGGEGGADRRANAGRAAGDERALALQGGMRVIDAGASDISMLPSEISRGARRRGWRRRINSDLCVIHLMTSKAASGSNRDGALF